MDYHPFDYKIVIKVVLIALIFSTSLRTVAEKITLLNDQEEAYTLNGIDFDVFEDPEQQYTIAEISDPGFEGFRKNQSNDTYNKNPTSAYWLKFSLKRTISTSRKYLLETYAPHSNQLEVYLPTNDRRFYKQQGGENTLFSERKYLIKNILFDLPMDRQEKDTVYTGYIRILSNNYSPFDYRIKTINHFLYYITNEYYFLGIYYGILLIMAVYNLMIYLSVKERVYLYYLLFVMSSALTTLTDDGLGFQYFWPNHPSWSRPIGYTIAPLIQLFAFVMYSISFLELKTRFYSLWKLVVYTTSGYGLYFIVSNLLVGQALPILYTIPYIIVYLSAWIAYQKGYKAARFYIIGFSIILVSIVIIQLRAEHSIEGNFFTVYSLNIGLVVEVVLFSYALADRIKLIKKEKELARTVIIESLNINQSLQAKVNRVLEETVTNRTQELVLKNRALEVANQLLIELNDKINQINSKLDYDNWYLKKDLKEDLQARISEEEVSYEEFKKIFPTDQTCQEYLASQKWAGPYRCRKCGNLKYSESLNSTKRKCTICAFVESATAFTLFHGVRFPLNKAFYLTYVFYRKKAMLTTSELSDLLEIRRNTCGKFKKKVIEHKQDFLLHHSNQEPESWEKLITMKRKKTVDGEGN